MANQSELPGLAEFQAAVANAKKPGAVADLRNQAISARDKGRLKTDEFAQYNQAIVNKTSEAWTDDTSGRPRSLGDSSAEFRPEQLADLPSSDALELLAQEPTIDKRQEPRTVAEFSQQELAIANQRFAAVVNEVKAAALAGDQGRVAGLRSEVGNAIGSGELPSEWGQPFNLLADTLTREVESVPA
ncbi:hypothetical protein KC614_00430 [candidate division WWE3 bacterium]|uniref:Uncharacterized protein n=1 Tax=candidate division WWE3 bacterium TaxID=2053526 RepID=A0A955LJA1_UNCKA|nr:hypothetical protein [candidate division WWE3 bacterium]